MSQEQQPQIDYVLKLDSDRRREIDAVNNRMDKFTEVQTELKHLVEMIGSKQDQLKERFETGTATTLRELKKDFSDFRVEWGEKKAQDKARDTAIELVTNETKANKDDMRKYMLWPTISLCLSLLLLAVTFLLKKGP